MKTFAICMLGCKVNDYEATCIRNQLVKEYKEVEFNDIADIYLVFTCCVTNVAEAKTRKFIHKARRNNPNALIVAIGCLAQIKGDTPDFDDVDIIVGSSQKDKILDLIKTNKKINVVKQLDNVCFEELPIDNYPGKSRAFLKIQDGCNQFCTYCVIPYSRGRERSSNFSKVIENAKKLSENFNEIVLTGIHTGRYNSNGKDLYALLCELVKIEKLKTIRLSSIELNEVNDQIIELMKNNDKLAHHLHIPIQAASNEILSLMHRPYSIDEYINRVEYIRKQIPDISISTDLIVGFPNETDEIFNNSLENLRKIHFSFIHVFPYSRKQGTVADKMNGHIDPKVKKQRVKIIESIQKDLTLSFNKSFIDKEVEVLIEKCDENYSYGYCKQYFYVAIPGQFKVGELITVVIKSASDGKIIGEYVSG